MKKSILATSLSAALCLLTSHSVMAQDISIPIDSSRTDTATGDQVGTIAYTASGKDTFYGTKPDINYTLTGDWSGLFLPRVLLSRGIFQTSIT